jgi:EmrB/QacA subfamily drug resistance transporter
VLTIVCAGVVLSSLDLFIVNVALPQIAHDLPGADLANLSWVLNAYAIVFAVLLVPAGRVADLTSRKGGFLLGVAIFTVASGLCAAAGSVGVLVALRVLQAAGAALLVPTSLGLVMAAYPADRRGGAVRAWAGMGGLAAALGPVLGGLLVTASWRWVFLVNVPIGLAALAAGWRVLPGDRVPRGERGPLPDVVGAVMLTFAIGALTLALVQSHDWGWTSGRVAGLLAGSAALLAAFVWRSARHRSPLLELDLLRAPSFTVALLSTLLFSSGFGAMLLAAVLWMQDDWHWSALQTGLAIAPGPLLVPVFSIVAGRLIPRLTPGGVIALGASVFALGNVWWIVAVGLRPDYVAGLLPGLLLTGVGVGLTLPTLFSTAASSLAPHRFATGSAVLSMVRQIGFAVGVAVLVAVLGSPAGATARLHAFDRGWLMVVAFALAAAAPGLLLVARVQRGAPAPQAEEA